MKFSFYFRLGIQSHWVSAVALSLLVACGGGGGGSSGGADGSSTQIETPLTGQVVKGLTAGATVSLYRVAADGSRTAIARVTTDATGSYSIPQLLVQGNVYLLEALNGAYVNEITGVVEPLTAPLRAIFVAGAPGLPVTLTALSDLVVREIELSTGLSKWSPTAVTAFTKIVEGRLGLTSLVHQKYIDLSKLTRENAVGLAESDLSFSNWVGVFAGFFVERKVRQPAATLSETQEAFRLASVSGTSANDELNSLLMAGLLRFYETVPVFRPAVSPLYIQIGLPIDANSADFAGAESSGSGIEAVPNFKLRFLAATDDFSNHSADTVFNSMGALLGFREGGLTSGASFTHLGVASVADVYADKEIAIGRWNRGYFYEKGVTYDASSARFNTSGQRFAALKQDMVYAAGIPASNLPACGRLELPLKAQTKAAKGLIPPTLGAIDPASKLVVQFTNGIVNIGYDIGLVDKNGTKHSFVSPGGLIIPWAGLVVQKNQNFSANLVGTSTSLSLALSGFLVGDGGRKAVITLKTSSGPVEISAVFSAVKPVQGCETDAFSPGLVSPIPLTDQYAFNDMVTTLTFTVSGTPTYPFHSSVRDETGVEKSGNDQAGIGVLVPPFSDLFVDSNLALVPAVYTYRHFWPFSNLPKSDVARYRLVSSTPYLLKNSTTVFSKTRRVQAATLEVTFGVDDFGALVSTCVGSTTVDGVTKNFAANLSTFDGTFSVESGGNFVIRGGVTSGDARFATITIRDFFGTGRDPMNGSAALLMERLP